MVTSDGNLLAMYALNTHTSRQMERNFEKPEDTWQSWRAWIHPQDMSRPIRSVYDSALLSRARKFMLSLEVSTEWGRAIMNIITHWGRVTQICVFTLQLCKTGDANLRFYITTVQDGWRKSAFLTRACFPCTVHLFMQYIEPVSEWFCWRMFIETWPNSELNFRHRASSI